MKRNLKMPPSTSRICLPVDELLDKHKGQMAFILGAGPSLRMHDMSALDDYVTFTVNRLRLLCHG